MNYYMCPISPYVSYIWSYVILIFPRFMLFPTFLKTYKTHKGYRTHELTTTWLTETRCACQYMTMLLHQDRSFHDSNILSIILISSGVQPSFKLVIGLLNAFMDCKSAMLYSIWPICNPCDPWIYIGIYQCHLHYSNYPLENEINVILYKTDHVCWAVVCDIHYLIMWYMIYYLYMLVLHTNNHNIVKYFWAIYKLIFDINVEQ